MESQKSIARKVERTSQSKVKKVSIICLLMHLDQMLSQNNLDVPSFPVEILQH